MKNKTGLFGYMSRCERRREADAYLQFLRNRNGVPDTVNRRLSARDALFQERDQHPVVWPVSVPTKEYEEARQNPKSASALGRCSQLALWMLVVASVNRDESFVIDLALKDRKWTDLEDPMTYVELEELYHTRILVSALRVLGVEVQMAEPRGFMRRFLITAAKVPKTLTNMFAILGEIVAVLLFVDLRDQAKQLFGTDTPAAQRIISLMEEILIDEVGHMAYVRTQLGPVEVWIVRHFLLPIVVPRMLTSHPAVGALCDARELTRRAYSMSWDFVPEDIRTQAFTLA